MFDDIEVWSQKYGQKDQQDQDVSAILFSLLNFLSDTLQIEV